MEKYCEKIVFFVINDESFNGWLCGAEWGRCGKCAAPDEADAVLGEVPMRMAWHADTAKLWREAVVCAEGIR